MTDRKTANWLESLLKRDRWVVGGTLVLVAAVAWGYTIAGAGVGMSAFELTSLSTESTDMSGTAMSMPVTEWTLAYAVLMLAMWWMMMVAMMLPSAAPTILLASALNRRSVSGRPPYGATGFFTAGYLFAWLLFGVVAVAAQWAMWENGQLSAMMRSTSPYLTGGLLMAAGLWQFTPIKQACLRHCRSPVEFLTRRRRPGNTGAFIMGAEHGAYCLGCCWFLMALLFAGGVMNLYWIAGLALYVLAEKLLPHGAQVGRVSGVALLLAGISVLVL
jgi:predicted metal-binding membrane protein